MKNARKSNDIGEFKNLFFNADIIKQIIQENKMVDTITLVELGFDEEDSYQNVKSRRNGYDDKSESRE